MNKKTMAALLFATLAPLAAFAQKLSCTEACYIEDLKWKLDLVAAEAAVDGNVYHQANRNRSNSKWTLEAVPNEPGYYYLRDGAHRYYLVAGDNYDGRVYHQLHRNRDNAKWRFVPVPGSEGFYNIVDKKHGKALAAADAYSDGNIYHQDAGGRRNAAWGIFASGAAQALALPATPFVLVDQRWGNAVYTAYADYKLGGVRALHGLRVPADSYPFGQQTILKFEAPDRIRLAAGNDAWYLTAGTQYDGNAYFVNFKDNNPHTESTWTMTTAGCNPGYFRLEDKKHAKALVAAEAYVDGNTYHQPANNRSVACWKTIAPEEYVRFAANSFLTSKHRPGPSGQNDEGSGSLQVAMTLAPPPTSFAYGEPSEGLTVGSECRAWIPYAPCAQYKRHCAVAWNVSDKPLLVIGSKGASAGSGRASATSWMLVPPQSGRLFQSIGQSRYVSCVGCGQKQYVVDGWVPPTKDGNKMKPVYKWAVPGGGWFYVGTVSTDNSDCPNALDLE